MTKVLFCQYLNVVDIYGWLIVTLPQQKCKKIAILLVFGLKLIGSLSFINESVIRDTKIYMITVCY